MEIGKHQIADPQALLAEYEANVALWQHDDLLRQQRSSTFLTVNTVLLTAMAALAALQVPLHYLGAMAFVFSLFGMVVSRFWHVVQVRNGEYVRFRRFQLLSIEARLPGLTTFRNTYDAFYGRKEIGFLATEASFSLSKAAQHRSTVSEGRLAIVMGVLWAIIGAGGLVVAWLG
jgi:hypothetical protein